MTYTWIQNTNKCTVHSTVDLGEKTKEMNRTITGAPAHLQCSAKSLQTMVTSVVGPIMLSAGAWFSIKSIIGFA